MKNYVVFVIRRLFSEKTRVSLTLLGIIIGITAVVSLISLSLGVQDAMNSQFEKLGTNRIMILPGGASSFMQASMSAQQLTDKDVKALNGLGGIKYIEPVLSRPAIASFRGKTSQVFLFGSDTDEKSLEQLKNTNIFSIKTGRELKSNEKGEAVLGSYVASKMFDEVKVGDKININGKTFKVVGIQNGVGSQVYDNMVRISRKDFNNLFNIKKDVVSGIIVWADKGEDLNTLKSEIEDKLRRERHVKRGNEDFNVQTSEQLIGSFRNILLIVQILLIGVGSISLIVGGINIMNSMYTSVLQRTKEIGIMKAIGAKNSDIILIFLIEAGLLGLVGGLVGTFLGFLISKSAQIVVFKILGSNLLIINFNLILTISALAFSFFIGILSGIAPAMQASRLKPAETLRYE